ncbi:hypothetical protein RZS08_32210, partial [Arthrospira platensis SPKY1]|nr:hypothetical protein [Arthrospira platensis SPKY1]
ATGGLLSNLSVSGALTIGASGSITGNNFSLTQSGGNIAGWLIQSGKLASAPANNARIELDDSLSRVSIISNLNETKVAMGYLNNLPKNDGTGNWGANNYGFWVQQGDRLVIDGDTEYVDGD